MPLAVAHGLFGATLVAALRARDAAGRRFRLALLAGFLLANCADLDFLVVFALRSRDWHRAFTHSLAFALVVGLLLILILGASRMRDALAYGLAYASHALLDFLTTKEGGGVEFLWPFSGERFALGWLGLSEVPSRLAPAEIMKAMLLELLIFAPPLLLVILLSRRRRARHE